MNSDRIENLYPVVKRLLGQIDPVGSTHVDEIRLENLNDTIDLIERLFHDVYQVSKQSNRMEHSISLAGKKANTFIKNIVAEYYAR